MYADTFRHDVYRVQTQENHDPEAAKLDGAKGMRREGKRLAKSHADAIARALAPGAGPCRVVESTQSGRVVVEWRNAGGQVLARYVETIHKHDVRTVEWYASEPDGVDLGKVPLEERLKNYANVRSLMHVTRMAGRRTVETLPLLIMTMELAKERGWPMDLAAVAVLSWARHAVGWTGRKSYRGPQLAEEAMACEHNTAALEAIHVLASERVRPFADKSGPHAEEAGCGLRFAEIAALRYEDVNLASKVVNVGGRAVPIATRYALDALRRYIRAHRCPKGARLFAPFQRWILGAKRMPERAQ